MINEGKPVLPIIEEVADQIGPCKERDLGNCDDA